MQHPMAFVYPNMTYIGSFPISELPTIMIRAHDDIPAAFLMSWVTNGLKVSPSLISKVQGKRPNPRHSGQMEWRRKKDLTGHIKELTTVVIKETLLCDGKSGCDRPRCLTNKKMRCAVVVWFTINLQDLHVAHIYLMGQHGQWFKLNPKAMRIALHIRQQILRANGLDYGTGGWTTAMKEVLRLQELTKEGRTTPDVVPTLKQVQNLLSFEWRKVGRGHGTIVTMLEWTLHDERVSPFVLFPLAHDESITEEVEQGRPFLIVMIGKVCVPLVRKYGCIIGLDGVFKIDCNCWPIYAVAVKDEEGHGWPIAFFFTLCKSKDILS